MIEDAKKNPDPLPCELCELIRELDGIVARTRMSEPRQAFNRMEKALRQAKSSHRVCAGCGLCFGGSHLAMPVRNVPGIGSVCKWCSKEIDKYGLAKFKKTLEDLAVVA